MVRRASVAAALAASFTVLVPATASAQRCPAAGSHVVARSSQVVVYNLRAPSHRDGVSTRACHRMDGETRKLSTVDSTVRGPFAFSGPVVGYVSVYTDPADGLPFVSVFASAFNGRILFPRINFLETASRPAPHVSDVAVNPEGSLAAIATGLHCDRFPPPKCDTEVWVARAGESAYRKAAGTGIGATSLKVTKKGRYVSWTQSGRRRTSGFFRRH